MAFNWTCPHCNHAQSVVDHRCHAVESPIRVGGTVEGNVAACFFAIGCSNPVCNKLTINFSIRKNLYQNNAAASVDYSDDPLYARRAIPESFAKPQPSYIPAALREDYLEACLIVNDSPKAAATLARRCIQGMIRDFCKIARSRLADEIADLRKAVESGVGPSGVTVETIDAIDQVRSIGNIGAHMEKDIDLLVPVDSGEASLLIELIEMLFAEWYVAAHVRRERLARISDLGAEKAKVIADARAASKALPAPTGGG
ncbi:DUF4145 domain-containing protein [Sphingomonas sp. MMS24-J13]|uniref:DUF4145 domain-containing protein n=1 Tax=Sphingomonas sp. MMS24-J13 TaxID=3238686 RepID=UPI00385147FE